MWSSRVVIKLIVLSGALAVVVLACLVAYRGGFLSLRRPARDAGDASPSAQTGEHAVADHYRQAVLEAEQDRGEPMGRRARADVPAELEHYPDRRRFLAIQAAKTKQDNLDIPHDFAALAALIRRDGQLVELPQLAASYLLYGVGYEATDELTHYDARSGRSVTLFANEEELDAEQARLSASRAQLDSLIRDLKRQFGEARKSETETRAALLAAIAFSENASESVKARRELIASFYAAAPRRRMLFSEYETLRHLAADLGAQTSDVNQPDARKRLKVRMLGFVRPATRRTIEALGDAYQSRFKRRLLVTSLMRPEEYQRRLRESGNANAADLDAPPHATGFAFDIYYGFMSAAEQQFVMEEIARMERAGALEALRERRDHFHVFVFADGRPPVEASVEKVVGKAAVKKEPSSPKRVAARRAKVKR